MALMELVTVGLELIYISRLLRSSYGKCRFRLTPNATQNVRICRLPFQDGAIRGDVRAKRHRFPLILAVGPEPMRAALYAVAVNSFQRKAMTDPVIFRMTQFNPRRASRGAGAAEFNVTEDGNDLGNFWMDEGNLRKNLARYPGNAELLKGLEHYRTREEYPARKDGA